MHDLAVLKMATNMMKIFSLTLDLFIQPINVQNLTSLN
jgi:hypothetical protein